MGGRTQGQVAGQSVDEDALRKTLDALGPERNVVVMDLSMPGIGGLEGTRRIAQMNQGARVLVLTMHGEEAADGEAADEEAREAKDVALVRPRNVAILTDEMSVSAAEAFVLEAMRNEKVTLFGQPTGGAIDYGTVGIVRFGCPTAGLYVGYPTIVASDRLPEGGVRPTGIVPDVTIDPAAPDPIQRIIEHYRQQAAGGY